MAEEQNTQARRRILENDSNEWFVSNRLGAVDKRTGMVKGAGGSMADRCEERVHGVLGTRAHATLYYLRTEALARGVPSRIGRIE